MRIIWPIIFSVLVLAALGLINIMLLKYLNKSWWRLKAVRWVSFLLPVAGFTSILVWMLGIYYRDTALASYGAISVGIFLITILALLISLPFSGLFNIFSGWLESRRPNENDRSVDNNRRLVIKAAAVAFPAVTVAAGARGVTHTFSDVKIHLLPIEFDNLPSALDGFRILHLTDSHLGIFKSLADLEDVVARAAELRPDMVLHTGDISDELSILPAALAAMSSIVAPGRAYAVLGNHEYYRGLSEVLQAVDRSEVTLLRSAGREIDIGEASIYLGGADDPVTMRGDTLPFLRKTVGRAFDNSPADSFKILMSHRPEGFVAAADRGIDLTLAGHTHGGQVGYRGRSFWSNFMSERYLWGEYEIGKARLYLSSGVGQWFPFRLGCPAEAPVIELRSSTGA